VELTGGERNVCLHILIAQPSGGRSVPVSTSDLCLLMYGPCEGNKIQGRRSAVRRVLNGLVEKGAVQCSDDAWLITPSGLGALGLSQDPSPSERQA
jgi:hypothetical protein